MPVSLYMHSVLCVLLMGERDIIMQHAFYRLDLNDVADWVRSPLLRICSQYNIAPIDDTQLLDLAELLVDYDINSRLSWTGHNSSYRIEEFCEFFGPAYRYNDEFYCEFDELRYDDLRAARQSAPKIVRDEDKQGNDGSFLVL